nr:sigma-70 family RNA polymerase sigma factor [Sphingobium sp. AS12]
MRPRLISLAYRITGSRTDAEDIVHEAALRWLNADRSNVRSPDAFLTTITTRLSLNHLRDRKARRETYPGDWLPEPVDTGAADRRELLDEISFGFLTMLERLTPLQRAVFILRSAFDCGYGEIASIVGRDEAVCRKIFSRAQAAVMLARPGRPVSGAVHKALLAEFLQAVGSGDISRLALLLADDVAMRGDGGPGAPALKRPLRGRQAVARFVVASRALLPADAVLSLGELNGVPAATFQVQGRCVLAVLIECTAERSIDCVFAISNPHKLRAIGEGLAA